MTLINPSSIKKYLRSFAKATDAIVQKKTGDFLILALTGPLKVRKSNLEPVLSADPRWPETLRAKFEAVSQPWQRFYPDPSLDSAIRHIADWIKSAIVNNEDWIHDLDAKGRPKKFAFILSLEHAMKLADDALLFSDEKMQAAQARLANLESEQTRHTVIEMQLENGFRIVKMLTPQALDYESAFLGHCIGQGAYDDLLTQNKFSYYSLRDAGNIPHATFAVSVEASPEKEFSFADDIFESRTLIECMGAQNEPPIAKYMPYVQAFAQARQFKLRDQFVADTGLLGQDGVYYDAFNLPNGFQYRRTLSFKGSRFRETKREICLPDNLYVHGMLIMGNCPGLKKLPNNLRIGGNTILTGCGNLNELPPDLFMRGALIMGVGSLTGANCYATGVEKLPETVKASCLIYDTGQKHEIIRMGPEACAALPKLYAEAKHIADERRKSYERIMKAEESMPWLPQDPDIP